MEIIHVLLHGEHFMPALIVGIPMMILTTICISKIYKWGESKRDKEVLNATSDFYRIEADLKQHLKDDGFVEPKPGSEEHYQRWKAEREKREP